MKELNVAQKGSMMKQFNKNLDELKSYGFNVVGEEKNYGSENFASKQLDGKYIVNDENCVKISLKMTEELAKTCAGYFDSAEAVITLNCCRTFSANSVKVVFGKLLGCSYVASCRIFVRLKNGVNAQDVVIGQLTKKERKAIDKGLADFEYKKEMPEFFTIKNGTGNAYKTNDTKKIAEAMYFNKGKTQKTFKQAVLAMLAMLDKIVKQ